MVQMIVKVAVTFSITWWNFMRKSSHLNRNVYDQEFKVSITFFSEQNSLVFKLVKIRPIQQQKLLGLTYVTC